jgi:hypothetical protein
MNPWSQPQPAQRPELGSAETPTGETRTIHNTYIPQQLVISIGWEKAVREAVRPELGGAVT